MKYIQMKVMLFFTSNVIERGIADKTDYYIHIEFVKIRKGQ